MRNAFADELTRLAATDERVVLLSGDIGNRLFDPYKAAFPDRFFNCGVAEANMIGVAAGLAMTGMRPVAYTIVPFVTTRCLEQIRVDVCYHDQPVMIVGVGGGLSYASLGGTHHACEDIALMRVLPGMQVVCPADALEVRGALRAALAGDAPVYIRLGKKGEPLVHEREPRFVIGESITLRHGSDVALMAVGNVAPIAKAASERLAARGVSVRLESFHSVKPLDERCLAEVFSRYPLVVTVEEHSRLGGAGSAVAEWLADHPGYEARLLTIAAPDRFLHEAGSQRYARSVLGLTPEAIEERVVAALEGYGAR